MKPFQKATSTTQQSKQVKTVQKGPVPVSSPVKHAPNQPVRAIPNQTKTQVPARTLQKPIIANQSPQKLVINAQKPIINAKNPVINAQKPVSNAQKTVINIKNPFTNIQKQAPTKLDPIAAKPTPTNESFIQKMNDKLFNGQPFKIRLKFFFIEFFDFIAPGFILHLLLSNINHLFIKHLIYFINSFINSHEHMLLKRTMALSIIFLIYLFLGAFIFQRLNLPTELEERQKIFEYKKWFLDNHRCVEESSLNELISEIEDAMTNGIVFVENSKEFTSNWSYGGETIFFVFTTLATIGYGQISPLTEIGKLFCIFYIITGVPLTMLILTLIVDKLEYELTKNVSKNRFLSYLDHKRYSIVSRQYSSIDNLDSGEIKYFSNEHYIYRQTFKVVLFLSIFVFLIPSYVFRNYTEPKWTFLDSLYYCYISAATVGFGDLVPGETHVGNERAVISNMLFLNMLLRLPLFAKIHGSWLKLKQRRLFKFGSKSTEYLENDQDNYDPENSCSIFPIVSESINNMSDEITVESKKSINRATQNRSA
ncbi:potassium channel subfamily K member 1-like [Brachionus plicatilis]|uniref:Potassium channel subfamily K member 1-like n=1 Tax=Brachionus plicatilis TaxID=10195 RepID=A0A3M7R2H3_BRAPC|nr:potassium channel subfamily K member 1-like [Brachionus plicatilis]